MKLSLVDPTLVGEKSIKKITYLSQIDDIVVYDRPYISNEELIDRIGDSDMIAIDVSTQITKDIIDSAKDLKAIFTMSVGHNNIDIDYARKKGVLVYNCSSYNSVAVAEYVFGSILFLYRGFLEANNHVLNGKWNYHKFEGLELFGKTMGIIGGGNIAAKLINRANAFGMKIMVNTLNPSDEKAKILGIKKFSNFKDILKRSDVLVVAVPLTSSTKGLISAPELDFMKKTSILINIARQTVVNERDLAIALSKNKIRGAVLDVILEEPFDIRKQKPIIQELVNRSNTLVTPHIAGTTDNSTKSLGYIFLQNIKAFLSEDDTNCVNC